MALKQPDEEGVYGCYACHTKFDGVASHLPAKYEVILARAQRLTRIYQERHGITNG